MRRRVNFLQLAVFALIVFLYLPLTVVVLFAFNSGSTLSLPISGLSFRWFRLVFGDPAFSAAFRTSSEAAVTVALIAVIVGTASALVFTRRRGRLIVGFQSLALLPAMLPPLFIAIALFITMDFLKVQPGFGPIIVGQLIIVTPFVSVITYARLQRFELELEEAARDLGASRLETMRRITLRIIFPALIGAFLLAMAFSFDEVLITNFTSGIDTTLPIYVFSKMHRSVDPSINAVATLLMAVPWVAFALAFPLFGRPLRRPGEGRRRSAE